MCLSCSGVHRGLGVHISFVRSITMDAFKPAELARMSAGGNDAWKSFWEGDARTRAEGRTWEDCTIRERYDGDVGEEYKARLSAKVEGREYVPGEERKSAPAKAAAKPAPRQASGPSSRSGTPAGGVRGGRSESPALGTTSMGAGRRTQNEAFFARMGAENAGRPDDVPPNQGGKYTGFGSEPWPQAQRQQGGGGMPGTGEFQQDPLAALTKGFGWFGGMVQKGVGEGLQKV
jgi:ADP-ribosylation factor GTPase-activating protein 1